MGQEERGLQTPSHHSFCGGSNPMARLSTRSGSDGLPAPSVSVGASDNLPQVF